MTSMVISPGATPEAATDGTTIALKLARFAATLRTQDIPSAVLERSKYLILDSVGIAYASTHYDFAHRALSAMTELSGGLGDMPVIGLPQRLLPRDAMLMNGILVHGLDYDDTHAAGVIHATASCFPCSMGVGIQLGASGLAVLTAYVIGMEAGTRLGAVAQG